MEVGTAKSRRCSDVAAPSPSRLWERAGPRDLGREQAGLGVAASQAHPRAGNPDSALGQDGSRPRGDRAALQGSVAKEESALPSALPSKGLCVT